MSAAVSYDGVAEYEAKRYSTGYKPRVWQREVHAGLAANRFGVLVCHRRSGKTVMSINAMIDAAARFEGGDGQFAYIAPFLKQAKRAAWKLLKRFALRIPGTNVHEGELTITFSNGSVIFLAGSDNYEALLGMYLDGVILDEVARMKPDVWGETIRPMLADRHGWAIFISTPKGINLFHELYEHALVTKGWYAAKYDIYDTGVIDAAEIKDARAIQTDAQFRQEWLCDFSASTEDAILPIDLVTDAMRREVPSTKQLLGLPKIIGVDVARFGGDRAVITKRWGHAALMPKVYRGIDNMKLVGHIGQEINKFKPDAVFIDGGRGEGVIDRLRQLGHQNIIEVAFGGAATNPKYADKASEMWDRCKDWMEEGGVLPMHKDWKVDFCTPTYEFDGRDRMKVESAKMMKKRGAHSPDIASAFITTFAEPVLPMMNDDTGMNIHIGQTRHESDYWESA